MRKCALLVVIVFLNKTAYSADFHCAAGNVGCLIAAINTANGNNEEDNIFLEAGEYTLSAVDNVTDGPNGLPSITRRVFIHGPDGMGSTIERDSKAPNFRLFHVAFGGDLRLDWIGLRNGVSETEGGGAIFNRGTVEINRNAIYNNRTPIEGGAIDNLGGLTISHSDIRNNTATEKSLLANGGAIASVNSVVIEDSFIFDNNSDLYGGGIYLRQGSGVMLRSTVSGNRAEGDGGGIVAAQNSRFWIEDSSIQSNTAGFGAAGISNVGGTLTMISSTVAQNIASNGAGGIANTGILVLKNVTVAENQTSGSGPAGVRNAFPSGGGVPSARLQNTIVALNTKIGAPSDCDNLTSFGNNVIGSVTGCLVELRPTDFVGDPGLGTFTVDPALAGSGRFPLLPASPAVNAANNDTCTPRDQIGNSRRGVCDIGAVELRVLAALP